MQVDILSSNFLSWFLKQQLDPTTFDSVVGNPPFIRYQYLDDSDQLISKKIFDHFHLPFTMHTNAWVPFVIASLALLSPSGRLAMVLPAELLHILHAQSLRKFLSQLCSRILIFDPQEIWFENTLQGAILLLAEKKDAVSETGYGIGIVPTRTTAFLSEDPEMFFQTALYSNGDTTEGKWMTALLSPAERQILREAKEKTGVYPFDQIATVAVGIVTGANKFFLVPDDVIHQYGLNNWAYPMFGRSEHVPGVIFDETMLQNNRDAGLPTNFIWFKDEPINELPHAVQEYLFSGEAEGLHKRYKCRIRVPWYSVPSVYSTDLGMLKRSHDFPRLILNKIRAFTTDTAYRIQSKQFSSPSLVYSFVNSLTALTAELEGRHYGGGVLELVPSEIRKLLLPVYEVSEEEVKKLDSMFRSGMKAENILACQDAIILKSTGFTEQECADLHSAWLKLRSRRQRSERL